MYLQCYCQFPKYLQPHLSPSKCVSALPPIVDMYQTQYLCKCLFCHFSFTPDFTMSRMRRTLSVRTSLGPAINYTLQATIPANMLTKCAAALPRPPWEPILYYSTICIMGFLLFCILVASYFEADRIFTAEIMRRRSKTNVAAQAFEKGRVFDLKAIAGVKPLDSSKVPAQKSTITTTTTNNNVPPTQQVEVSNGHVENRKKKDTSRGISLFGFFKRLFARPKSLEKPISHPLPERQNSRDKDSKLTPANSASTNTTTSMKPGADKHSTAHENNSIMDKTPLVIKLSNKKAKAAKRQHHSDLINDIGMHDRKQGGRDVSSGVASTTRNVAKADLDHHKYNLDKDKTHTSYTDLIMGTKPPANSRKVERNMISGLDPIEPSEVTIVTEDLDLDGGKNGMLFKNISYINLYIFSMCKNIFLY